MKLYLLVLKIGITIIMMMAGSLWLWQPAKAQIDAFTFFVPFSSSDVDAVFAAGRADSAIYIDADIETTISIAILNDNTIIYYDEWEDGLEPDLTAPIQPTTRVWGDGDPANNSGTILPVGIPANDILTAGTVITLENDVINPRTDLTTQIFFDGGDKFTAVGGPVTATMAVWPIRDPALPPVQGGDVRILYADAWEIFPTNSWGTDYRLPIGQNLAPNRPGFTVVSLNVQAVQDNTTVDIDADADGTADETIILNQGEQYIKVGSLAEPINVGAYIQASNPIQVQIAATNPNTNFELRGYSLIPTNQWADSYLASRSSDGDFWLYNPNDTDLPVSAQTISATTVITIPANSTIQYPQTGLITQKTGVHFSSLDERPFYGVAALDLNSLQDWGYALLPTTYLTPQVLVAWGIGNDDIPPTGDESRVYVTALQTTTLQIDYNNDSSVDTTVVVTPLVEIDITDDDNDMTGAFIYNTDGVSFSAVWGQDQNASDALPSIDAGANIIPIPNQIIKKNADLAEDTACTGFITPGDTVRFELQYFNNAIVPISGLIVEDNLPPALTYVPSSTVIDDIPVADAATGTPFLLDEGGYAINVIPARSSGFIRFEAVPNTVGTITNRADLKQSGSLTIIDSATTAILVEDQPPVLEFQKTLIAPSPSPVTSGQVITFGLTIANTGPVSSVITTLPLQDEFDPTYLTFLDSMPCCPDITTTGTITWNDLTNIVGDVTAGNIVTATLRFKVNEISTASLTITHNIASLFLVERNDNIRPLNCEAMASVQLATPISTPTPSPTPTATSTPSPTLTPSATPTLPPTTTKTPSSPPTGTPIPLVSPIPIPSLTPVVLPVLLLPQTGWRGVAQPFFNNLGLILTIVVLIGIVIVWIKIKRHP